MAGFNKRVLVIGGGTAGLSACAALHRHGLEVHVVEQEQRLGGKALGWACMATDTCRNCGACLAAALAEEVSGLEHVSVHCGTRVADINRKDDGFEAVLTGQHESTLEADAVLMACGFSPFDPAPLASLGYGVHEHVITTVDLNRLLKHNQMDRMLPKTSPARIAFIQCVGSRNRQLGRDYCSQVCCKISLRQAQKLLHLYPDAAIAVFHIDLQIIGKTCRTLYGDLSGRLAFRQGVPAEIAKGDEDGRVTIIHEDENSGQRTAESFDLVVLSVGMGPVEQSGFLAEKLEFNRNQWGFFEPRRDGGHTGVYAVGTAVGPMGIVDAIEQGKVAAAHIARDLRDVNVASTFPAVAVLGGGDDAVAVAEGLSRFGYPVRLLDPGDNNACQAEGIDHYTNAKPLSVEGVVGDYLVRIKTPDGMQKIKAGAFVVANGAERKTALSGTAGKHCISMEELAALDEDGLGARIAFWLDAQGPEWKENVARVLETAHLLAEKGRQVYVLMEKMLVHGMGGQRAYDAARKAGVVFLRLIDPSSVSLAEADGAVAVSFHDTTLPGVLLSLTCDHLVLPHRVVPDKANPAIAGILKQDVDVEGFAQSENVRHRPVGCPRKGVFYAGACHDEIDAHDLEQEIEAVAAGIDALFNAVSSGSQAPEIDEKLCARCLTCFRTCRHRAIVLQDEKKPRIVPHACYECGLCVASCPAKAIGQQHWNDADLVAGAQNASTLVFACERSAMLAAGEARRMGLALGDGITVQPVKCAGRISIETMLTALLSGAGRVVVAGCHRGNCRSMDSSLLAEKRVGYVREQTHQSEETIGFYPVAANEPEKFIRIVTGKA